MNIGKSVKIALAQREMQGKDLAIEMGVSQGYISGLATGRLSPNVRVLTKLAVTLGYSVSDFVALGESENDISKAS